MDNKDDITYSTVNGNGDKIEYSIKDYNLPFYHFEKTIATNTVTGKKDVTKRIIKKSQEDLLSDVIIVSVSATAINMIGNGLSHLIYSIKKKNKKK